MKHQDVFSSLWGTENKIELHIQSGPSKDISPTFAHYHNSHSYIQMRNVYDEHKIAENREGIEYRESIKRSKKRYN